jgi:hypothetical protein
MKLEDVIKSLDRMEWHAHKANGSQYGSVEHNKSWDNFEEEKDKLITALRAIWVDSNPLPSPDPVNITPSECLKLLNATRLDLTKWALLRRDPIFQRRADAIRFAINQMLKADAKPVICPLREQLPNDRRSATEIVNTLKDLWNWLSRNIDYSKPGEERVIMQQMDCLRIAIHAVKDGDGDTKEQLKHIQAWVEKMLEAEYRKEIFIKDNDYLSLKVFKVIKALNTMREEREQIKKVFALLRGEVVKA